jgi:DUF1009 family protein
VPEPIGLIAGEGVFPFLVARGAKAAGRPVVCTAFAGIADPSLADEVDAFRNVSYVRPTSWARFLRRNGCREAIMVGRVKKRTLHGGGGRTRELLWALRQVPDHAAFWAWLTVFRHDRRSDTVLRRTADELKKRGVTLIDSTTFCRDQMATPGPMTKRPPTPREQASIDRGWHLGRLLSQHDVGQSIAVRDGDVLAIEAVEGTDAMIARAGELCRGSDWVLIKRGNTNGDPRFDVPTIGVGTVTNLHAAGGTCICVEADAVILLEKQKVVEVANRLDIAIVALPPE